MIYQTPEKVGAIAASPNDRPALAINDNFFSNIGVKYQQNILTDLDMSEGLQYNDVIRDILGHDDIDVAGGAKQFNYANVKLLDDQWDNGFYELDKKGNVVPTDVYNQGNIMTNKFMPTDRNVKAWLDLKAKGYTPDSINDLVVSNTKQEWADRQKELAYYDDDNMWGMSGLSETVSDMGAWLSDPVNAAGLGVEITAFKVLGKSILKEGRGAAIEIAKNLTGKNIGVIGSLSSKYGQRPTVEALNFITGMRMKGVSAEDIVGIFKNKGKGLSKPFEDPKTQAVITDLIRNEKLKELAFVSGFSGFVGFVTEALFQEGTFDFKTQVLSKYGEDEKNRDIALSGGFGLAFGGAFNLVGNLVGKQTAGVAVGEGVDTAMHKSDAIRAASDIEDDIPINGLTKDDLLEEREDVDLSYFDGDEAQIEMDLGGKDSYDFKEFNKKRWDAEQWEKVEACFNQNI